MILDNADDVEVLFHQDSDHSRAEVTYSLSDFLPQSPNGSIIVTSRNRDLAFRLIGRDSDIIKIMPMEEDHALALLRKKLPGNLDQSDAAELIQALDYFPLAITQAASYISQRAPRITVSRYLRELRSTDKDRATLLQKDAGDPRRDGRVSNSIITTFHISFEYIRKTRSSAARLLSLMSLFDRQGIPESLLIHRYQEESDIEASFEDDISTLTSYSLVIVGVEGTEFEMHRLVQFSTKNWLEYYDELEQWKEKFIDIMAMSFPVDPYENWITCQKLFPHAGMVLSSYPTNEDYLIQWASVLFKAAWYSTLNGSYDIAEKMNQQALAGREKALGAEHPDTLTSVNNLALVLQSLGKYELAEEMNRRALAGHKKVLGKAHPDTLTSISNLSLVLQSQGKYDLAAKMDRRALAGREKALGKEHPDTLTSVGNLARTLQSQGKYDLAAKMDRRALAGREKVLGTEHPHTLTSVNNLALVLQSQGKYKLAEEMSRRALAGREKVLGTEHPDTLSSVDCLAGVLRLQGKYELAEEMNRRALAGYEKTLGTTHPVTLTMVSNLALVLQCQDKYELAEEMDRRALTEREKLLGTEHPDTLTSLSNLSLVLQSQGKYDQAEKMDRRALARREKILGTEHPDTLTSVGNLSLVLQCLGKCELAEEMSRRALVGRERVLGTEHPDTLTSVYCLAYLLEQREQYQESLGLYQRACAGYEVALGKDHPTTTACSEHYSSLLSTAHGTGGK
jgi:tetratricopeptide (TPR) repeat protein